MKNIAIITFHRACNYGAFLQAYALQETLNQYEDVNAYIFDYRSKAVEEGYSVDFYLKRDGKNIKTVCKYLADYNDVSKRNRIFETARNHYYKYKENNVMRQDLPSVYRSYDAFIVGSDQVWNRDIIKDDDTYFLDFVKSPTKKYSYAASIGKERLSERELQELAALADGYTYISVREADIIPQLSEIESFPPVCCSIDPVFLFTANQWRKFATFKDRDPYLLLFIKGKDADALPAMRFAREFAKDKNLKVLFLSDCERWYKFRDLKHFGVATPAEFVGLIDHAEYVITNSFHGTAFSIMLHKKFFVETKIARNNRILHLLDLFGLQQCGLVEGKQASCIPDVNWSRVDETMRNWVADSTSYLGKIISDIKK